ncbi:hypothetical protein [Microcystis aeruginosa]|nr:hypothetical protein [Microcystis aeruginosa]
MPPEITPSPDPNNEPILGSMEPISVEPVSNEGQIVPACPNEGNEGQIVLASEEEKEKLVTQVNTFRTGTIIKRKNINQGWKVGLTVSGLTLTAITSILGVVNIGDSFWKNIMAIGIGVTGAGAVATQSAGKEVGVKRKAGLYFVVDAELVILEDKIPRVRYQEELEVLRAKYYEQVREAAKIEATEE